MKIVNAGNRMINNWLFPVENGWAMVDTGRDKGFEAVQKRMEKQGVDPKEIRFVFLTHAHADCAGFLNELLTSLPHAKCICSQKAIPVLHKEHGLFDGGCTSIRARWLCRLWAMMGGAKKGFPRVDERFTNRILEVSPDNLVLAEKLLGGKILFTPGHTADSISLLRNDVIFCGDAATGSPFSRGKISLWIWDRKTYEASWQKMLDTGAKTLYPAHGKPFAAAELARNQGRIERLRLYPMKKKQNTGRKA